MRHLAMVLTINITLMPPVAWSEPAPDSLFPIGTYAEVYQPNPKISGSLLVGLRWGGADGYFDPHDVRLQLPATLQGGHACVDVASKDGRYTAENLYAITNVGAQAKLDAHTNYTPQLKAYQTADVGVIIRAARDCGSEEDGGIIPAVIVPLHMEAATVHRRLIAEVNADPETVSAVLLGAGGADIAAKTACVAAGDGVRIAYSTTCTIDAQADLPRAAITLRLSTKERFKTIDNDFILLMP